MSVIVEYSLRRQDGAVTVTKFEDDVPRETYTVKGRADCDCPGAVHHKVQCKHMKLVAAWIQAGEPAWTLWRISATGRTSFQMVEGAIYNE